MEYRIGNGYDLHRLEENRKLILGGIEVPFELGLLGHSDADVVVHAIIDAMLGGLCLGDIGQHFPPSDSQYKDINSLELLQKVYNLVKNENYSVVNIDVVIQAEKPKLWEYIPKMRQKLSNVLDISENKISIKAKTMEKLGDIGESRAMAAYAVILLGKE